MLYSEEGQFNPKAARSERKQVILSGACIVHDLACLAEWRPHTWWRVCNAMQAKRQKKMLATAAAQCGGDGSDSDFDLDGL